MNNGCVIGKIEDNKIYCDYFRQGYIYKNENNLLNTIDLSDEELDKLSLGDKIIYIPENVFDSKDYVELNNSLNDGSDYYTVKSIKDDIKTYFGEDVFNQFSSLNIKDMILDVFETLDWQHPYSLIEGDEYLDEFVKELGIDLNNNYEI